MAQSSGNLQGAPAPVVVERLGQALVSIPAGRLRHVYLAQKLEAAPPLECTRVLACAQRDAMRGAGPARIVVETFSALLQSGGVSRACRCVLSACAMVLGEQALLTLLDLGPANDSGDSVHKPPAVARSSLAAAGETLGRRKALARQARGDLLMKILDDPHVSVIENALLNPAMTEKLVLRLATRRPVSTEVLGVIAHSRFGQRPVVRRAVVLNPACPLALASWFMANMTRVELGDIERDPKVPEDLRASARILLAHGGAPKRKT